jgi:hypothetical protein
MDPLRKRSINSFSNLPVASCDKDVAWMVARISGSALGLLAFTVTVFAGLYVRNPVSLVLSRGILALFLFFAIGLVLGVMAQRVIAERVRTRETEIRKQYSQRDGAEPDEPSLGGPADERAAAVKA